MNNLHAPASAPAPASLAPAIDPDDLRLRLGSVHARAFAVAVAAGLPTMLLIGILTGAIAGVAAYWLAHGVLYRRAMREMRASD